VAASTIISIVSLLVVAILGLWNIYLGKRTTKAAEESARATKESVKATELATALAQQDARLRRVEGILDVLLEIRDTWNKQHADHRNEPGWVPALDSPEQLARLDLCRKLDGRLLFFGDEIDSNTAVRTLARDRIWTSNVQIDQAIDDMTKFLKTASTPSDSSPPLLSRPEG
jgi:hypothetical protein